MDPESLTHPFPPVCDGNSRILILGSFPSAASRRAGFYYGHPRNRFWRVLEAVTGETVPEETEGRREFLLAHGIALWDSIGSCEIEGSSDVSIKNAAPNPIAELIAETRIERVFCNGKASHACYEKYVYPLTGVHAVFLPSTSPANAAWSVERLAEEWKRILGKE
ncbi:MAG: DNA-deoxyinosine glycosylase [Clostridia bacterium]|nr:DNA-deoxyinosine glycosylase [Clostridia bacterium]